MRPTLRMASKPCRQFAVRSNLGLPQVVGRKSLTSGTLSSRLRAKAVELLHRKGLCSALSKEQAFLIIV